MNWSLLDTHSVLISKAYRKAPLRFRLLSGPNSSTEQHKRACRKRTPNTPICQKTQPCSWKDYSPALLPIMTQSKHTEHTPAITPACTHHTVQLDKKKKKKNYHGWFLSIQTTSNMLTGPYKQTCKHSQTTCHYGPDLRPVSHPAVRGAVSADNNAGIMFTPQKRKGQSKIRCGCK